MDAGRDYGYPKMLAMYEHSKIYTIHAKRNLCNDLAARAEQSIHSRDLPFIYHLIYIFTAGAAGTAAAAFAATAD